MYRVNRNPCNKFRTTLAALLLIIFTPVAENKTCRLISFSLRKDAVTAETSKEF
jgi:hypothetical protein